MALDKTIGPGSASGRLRRAGVLIGTSVVLLLMLSAWSVLAGAASGGNEEELRASGMAGEIQGTERADVIHGLSGDDEIFGKEGADEIYGGPGRDVMFGGSGDDFIEAKDGLRDSVSCGAGHDVASVDEEDRVAGDCEVVYRA